MEVTNLLRDEHRNDSRTKAVKNLGEEFLLWVSR